MATTRVFQDMLNDFLPNELLKEEFVKRDYLLSKVEKDETWKGGPLIVPFKAAGASSVSFGSLTAAGDIAEDKFIRGQVDNYKEVWGTMVFNHRDLMEHGQISEQNFLKILPGAVEDFMDYMKNVVSVNLLNGAHFATVTAIANQNDGTIVVDRPDRLVIGQKVQYSTSDATAVTSYVKSIDMNTLKAVLVTTRGGAGVVNFAAAGKDLVLGTKLYNDGAAAGGFSSLRNALLANANVGAAKGDAQLYGVTKTLYPYLQAINIDGTNVTAVNIVESIFDAFVTIRQFGRGNPTDVIMSYKNLGSCMKVIETSKGAYNVTPGSQKASQYGWTEIEVGSVTQGGLKLVGVQEADDDVILFIDWRALKFYSNGLFQKRKSPDGKEYFETRATTGYQYILDVSLFGELVVTRPSYCGIMHTVAY